MDLSKVWDVFLTVLYLYGPIKLVTYFLIECAKLFTMPYKIRIRIDTLHTVATYQPPGLLCIV